MVEYLFSVLMVILFFAVGFFAGRASEQGKAPTVKNAKRTTMTGAELLESVKAAQPRDIKPSTRSLNLNLATFLDLEEAFDDCCGALAQYPEPANYGEILEWRCRISVEQDRRASLGIMR